MPSITVKMSFKAEIFLRKVRSLLALIPYFFLRTASFFQGENCPYFHLRRLRCSSSVNEVNFGLFEVPSEEAFSKLDFSVVSHELVRVAEIMRQHVLQGFFRAQLGHYILVLGIPFQQDDFSHSGDWNHSSVPHDPTYVHYRSAFLVKPRLVN